MKVFNILRFIASVITVLIFLVIVGVCITYDSGVKTIKLKEVVPWLKLS